MQETQKACGGGLFSGSSPENDTSFSSLISPATPKGFYFLSDCTFIKCLQNRGGDLLTKNSHNSIYVGIQ